MVFPYFRAGEMAERSNAAVLKTVDCNRSGGSNPSLSAFAHRSFSVGGLFIMWASADAVRILVGDSFRFYCQELSLIAGFRPPNLSADRLGGLPFFDRLVFITGGLRRTQSAFICNSYGQKITYFLFFSLLSESA